MSGTDRELFKQALIGVFKEKCDQVLAQAAEDTQCSDAHYIKMSRILGVDVRPEAVRRKQTKRRTLVALLVAAILLLTGCAVYVYRNAIGHFIEELYEENVKIVAGSTDSSETVTTIVDHYTLSYVPEGYELVDQLNRPSVNQYKWQNPAGEYIVFQQSCFDGTSFGLDAKAGETTILQQDSYTIYYRASRTHSYIWTDGRYSFKLTTSVSLTDTELYNIIQGMVLSE